MKRIRITHKHIEGVINNIGPVAVMLISKAYKKERSATEFRDDLQMWRQHIYSR